MHSSSHDVCILKVKRFIQEERFFFTEMFAS